MNDTHVFTSSSEKWGYSFLGVTFGVSSVFVAPVVFSLVQKNKLYSNLPWLACFGGGVILALIFNTLFRNEMSTLSWLYEIAPNAC